MLSELGKAMFSWKAYLNVAINLGSLCRQKNLNLLSVSGWNKAEVCIQEPAPRSGLFEKVVPAALALTELLMGLVWLPLVLKWPFQKLSSECVSAF